MAFLTSSRFGMPFLAAGQAQKELTHNEALALVDAALHAAVESAGLDEPPSAPLPGQCWIVGPAPSGAWAGQPHALACWTESGWRFVPAVEGMCVWRKDEQLWAERRSGAWVVGEARASELVIGGAQVVGARKAAVALSGGGAVIDAEARAAIASIIDRLVAHGLIAG